MSNSKTKDEMQRLNVDLLQEVEDRVGTITEEPPEHDPETLAALDRVEALFHAKEITKDEVRVLIKQIMVRSPRFSLVARTKLNYNILMEDFSAAWEKHAENACTKTRDFIYMCGEWVVKVGADGTYSLMSATLTVGHKGVIKPVVFTGVFVYSCGEILFEAIISLLLVAGGGVKKAWVNTSNRVSGWNDNRRKKNADTVTLESGTAVMGHPTPISVSQI